MIRSHMQVVRIGQFNAISTVYEFNLRQTFLFFKQFFQQKLHKLVSIEKKNSIMVSFEKFLCLVAQSTKFKVWPLLV